MAASAARAARGASGVAVTSGRIIVNSSQGSNAIATSVGTDAATSHEPKPISRPWPRAISAPSGLAAIAVNHSADDTVRLAMPENIRNAPTRGRVPVPGCGTHGLGNRQRERVEHAGPGRVAGKRRSDQAVHEEDAVAQAERRAAEHRHRQVAKPRAQPALHHGARHEERHHDQQDRAVREPLVGLGGRQRAGQDGRRRGRAPMP